MGGIPSSPEVWFMLPGLFVYVVGFLGLYFLPSLIVGIQRVRAGVPVFQVWAGGGSFGWRTVFLVNLFSGWTVIGWFVALLMAFAREDRATQTRE